MKNFYRYLNISQTEEDWGFYITTAGYLKTSPHHSYPQGKGHPNDHAFTWNKGRILDGYYLVFISKGEGIFESDYTPSSTIKEGTVFFLFPGLWHRYKPKPTRGWEEYWVGFKGNYPDQLMRKNFFSPKQPFFNAAHNTELLQLFHQLIQTVQLGNEGYNQIAAGITLQILAVIFSINHTYLLNETAGERTVRKAKFLLQESLEQAVHMEDIANQLAIGYSSFRRLFKEATGLSPNQYLLELRLNKAKELLATTSLSIQQIADHTGFASIHYFSKLFSQKNGQSPKTFREEIRTNAL